MDRSKGQTAPPVTMQNRDIKSIDQRLRGLDYPEIERALSKMSTAVLVKLLDSRSIKVGDSAADVLAGRDAYSDLVSAFIGARLRLAVGRIRALNLLHRCGLSCDISWKAYEAGLADRSTAVLDCALFGLVFSRRKSALPLIDIQLAKSKPGSPRYDYLKRAKLALESDSPQIYSPGFHDAPGVWRSK